MCRQIRGVAPITLYLGVKFYAADPCRLVEEITRYQFFLQVKQDVLQGRLPVTQDLAVELAALALQCMHKTFITTSRKLAFKKYAFSLLKASITRLPVFFGQIIEVTHSSISFFYLVAEQKK